jgi:hypothetical protein
MLAGQISAARDGIVLARAMADKEITPAQARTRIAEVERQGDEMRAQLVEQLSRTLVAPLDREDLFRLSRSIDDVLDTIRDFLREADMYHIEQRASYLPLLDGVEAAIDALGSAIATMWTAPHEVPLKGLAAKKAARQVNRAYQDGFAKIVGGDMTPAAIKRRELTKRLDWVGVRITEAANVLTDGALKRGY